MFQHILVSSSMSLQSYFKFLSCTLQYIWVILQYMYYLFTLTGEGELSEGARMGTVFFISYSPL